jgi:hypothetical protein
MSLFIGTVIVSVALGAKFDPLTGFIFFGTVCMVVGVVETIYRAIKAC